ncbi:MAG TPA: DUF192 domain-containing protein [Spirochaetota bacterium]|nr:DUF192 domain-containing protein [Spirochaetota bacterium]
MRSRDITIVNSRGVHVTLKAEMADTEDLRLTGLMHRSALGADDGMLFVFENEQMLHFWMKNTSIPLSIAYIDKNGRIIDILDMKPFDISITYPSSRKARYALEMNRGWFGNNNIMTGCKLILDGCIGK